MHILYTRISEIIEKRNISTYSLEKGSGIGLGTFRSWETSDPSCDRVLKVANYLDVSVDYLLGNTDNPHSQKNDSINIPPAVEAVLRVLDRLDGVSANTIAATSEARNDIKIILGTYHLGIDNNNSVAEDVPSSVNDE